MPTGLLQTKLYAPKRRRGLVPRPQLTERLVRGAESKLTLVSAPAGFGKSTLLAEWLGAASDEGSATAWLSLDPADNAPGPFWTHVIAALRGALPGVGEGAQALLESPGESIETVLAPLINELAAVPGDVVLVLDDYHVIDAPEIQTGMTFLLEHLPAPMHLVIATRVDPALPLARLRARGELVEIRAGELRFTPDEAREYFNGTMGLVLTEGEVADLERRTEGWIAALQLAGLSMQGRDDIAGFIAGFAGDDRYIVDYLVEEVLARQSQPVRAFLLETSILNRLSGSLCDAVTLQVGGKATLEALDRGNLFLIPLDDRRQWYRYHHLFADVLRVRLLDEQPGLAPQLHRRACEWHEAHGDRPGAIRHAMAGGDLARAASLVELAIPATVQQRGEATLRQWLEALPDELLRFRPVLSNAYAGTLLSGGEVQGVEQRLRDAEAWMEGRADGRIGQMVVADEAAFRQLPGSVAVHRAGQALMLGDVAGTVAHAQRALALVDEDDHRSRGGAAALLALAHWANGDLEIAGHWYAIGMTDLEKAGHLSDVIGCGLALADIRLAQGRLSEALGILERGLVLATGQGGRVLRGAADMHVGISAILRERNDITGARQQLLKADELGEDNGLPQNRYRSRVALATIRQAEGDADGALALLSEAERVYVSDFSPGVRPVAAVKARALIAAGRLTEAAEWARERGLTPDDELSYVHEFAHITLARLLLGQGMHGTALLERLLTAAEAGGRSGSAVEILVLLALAHRASNDVAGALATLDRAVAIAAPERFVRVFVDEGAPMTSLLQKTAKRGGAHGYTHKLLAATGQETLSARPQPGLVEPLSERELDVLQLLASDLDGPGIARELYVSLNTMRSHTKSIFTKLGVNSRREAVRRATELELLSRTSRDR
jgi:LuxR family maltose regulon positive regulatory protein